MYTIEYTNPVNNRHQFLIQYNFHGTEKTLFAPFYRTQTLIGLLTLNAVAYWRLKSFKNKTTNNENKD